MSLKITIYTPGQLDKSYQDVIANYAKRISRFAELNWRLNKTGDKKTENDNLLKQLIGQRYIVLDERGDNIETTKIAKTFALAMHSGNPTINIVIGGAYGLSDDIINNATEVWAFGKITLPHQMVRLIVVEQIYRALTIINNHPYHHD